jgi:SAM-dependent methyltransferase
MTSHLSVPPEALNKHIGGRTADDYANIGEEFLEIFQKYGGIKPTDRVLDVGCGCGRMAMPLTRFLTTGSYEGFDILPELIEWCQQNITPRYPNFHFQLAGVHHGLYSKDAKLKASDFQFPFADDFFDFAFLTSVFTHLLQEDLEHYTREVVRTLRPGGTALITFFILNEESEGLMDTTSDIKIPHEYGKIGAKVTDPEHPEAVIAYPETFVRQILADCGLILQEPIHFGFWCGRQGSVTYQDLVVCRRGVRGAVE